jgi:hypothetical protein
MATTWEHILRTWVKPPSEHEDAKRDKTEGQIKEALSASLRLKEVKYRVYAQGSYANNTNVRLDYDMDIAVECTEFFYHDFDPLAMDPTSATTSQFRPYGKGYSLTDFKADIEAALVDRYGRDAIIRGNTALRVREERTTLPADVVPCCEYRLLIRMDQLDGLQSICGTLLRPDRGPDIINWPQQQLENGIRKNNSTNHRYKDIVRALKCLKNQLVKEGKLSTEFQSFLIECLVYNVPDGKFNHSKYVDEIHDVLAYILDATLRDDTCSDWTEVNERKRLFDSSQPWSYQQAHDFAGTALNRMGFE